MKEFIILCAIFIMIPAYSELSYAAEFYEKDDGKFALSAKVGTLGPGIEGVARINPKLNARVGVNALEFDYSGKQDDIEYDIDLGFFSVSTLLDWHPFEGIFRLSAGAVYNQNSLDMKAKPSGSYQIGSTAYTTAQVGTLKGDLDFEEFCPYIGVGWGNALTKNKTWSFSVDLGVIYQGSPNINLSADGTLSGTPAFQANLTREENSIEDDIEDFEFYPVISFGITYSF